MTHDVRAAPPSLEVCRYALWGGATAWALWLLVAVFAAAAMASRAFEAAALVAVVGWAGYRLSRSAVVETAPAGLTRGWLTGGAFSARATIIPWATIVEVHTAWRRPGDDSGLETVVRDRAGRVIGLSTAMGLAAYWGCLAEIVRHAPAAARTGLTDAVLADGPPTRRDLVSAAGAVAALALVLVALVALHALWAQGRSSSVARDAERIGAVGAAGAQPDDRR